MGTALELAARKQQRLNSVGGGGDMQGHWLAHTQPRGTHPQAKGQDPVTTLRGETSCRGELEAAPERAQREMTDPSPRFPCLTRQGAGGLCWGTW